VTEPVRWRPSPLTLSLATASATALALALIGRRPELIAFAAPLLGALAGGCCRVRPASHITLRPEQETQRCFENEVVAIRVHAHSEGMCDEISLRPLLPPGLELISGETVHSGPATEWQIRATRWGRFSISVEITARTAGGLLTATLRAEAGEIRVYPKPAPLTVSPRPASLPDRIGVHIGRRRGEGVEFAAIRPYVAGDPLGQVNWPVSARLGRLHVTERLAERATDVVALVDTYPVADPDQACLDLAVHGAAEIVQAALRRGDRAGVLALGGGMRWLGPDVGRRQFYRIADAVLDATAAPPSFRPSGGRLPRAALPPHACVVAFTPLLDARVGLALQDVRGRGHATLVVDVLREPPAGGEPDPMAERLWRLERRGLHRDLASVGIPVVPWGEWSTLDEVLYPLARRPLQSGRPPR
jgi:uncharacterized protein (DUF58 family)